MREGGKRFPIMIPIPQAHVNGFAKHKIADFYFCDPHHCSSYTDGLHFPGQPHKPLIAIT